MTKSDQVPSPAKGDWRWMATGFHTCGSGLSSQSPNGHAHIWPALWSICHRLQIHLAVSLSDHQHCVWMCYSPPNTQAHCLLDQWLLLYWKSYLNLLKTSMRFHYSVYKSDYAYIRSFFIGVWRVTVLDITVFLPARVISLRNEGTVV